jgi:TolB-like protein/Tfp pilus assembly protein PilF
LIAIGYWLIPLRELETSETGKQAWENSIAVLPFENISADPEQEHFCDGITDQIITNLSKLEILKVIGRTSVMQYKNTLKTIPEIGKELKVANILEGSASRFGNRIRVIVKLVDTKDGTHLWADNYDYGYELDGIFAIYDDVSQSIAKSLLDKLTVREISEIRSYRPSNTKAYEYYILGRQFRQRKDKHSFNQALDYFKEAVTLDPNFAVAYAEIALTYVLMGGFNFILRDNILREEIIYYVNKALELDKNVSDAYLALALLYEGFDHNRTKAEELASRAVCLNPGNSEAIQEHGFILGRMGKYEEAIKKMESTIALDPLSINANNGLGYVYFYKGDFNTAIKHMQNILVKDPEFFPARHLLSLSLTELGDYSHALEELNKCPKSNPVVIAHIGYIHAKMGNIKKAFNSMEEIKKHFIENPLFEFLVALIYTGMDDKDNAFDWLKKSQKKYGFVYRDGTVGSDFRMDNLRKDQRFNNLFYF